jgi:hypothetical protein
MDDDAIMGNEANQAKRKRWDRAMMIMIRMTMMIITTRLLVSLCIPSGDIMMHHIQFYPEHSVVSMQ